MKSYARRKKVGSCLAPATDFKCYAKRDCCRARSCATAGYGLFATWRGCESKCPTPLLPTDVHREQFYECRLPTAKAVTLPTPTHCVNSTPTDRSSCVNAMRL